MGFKDAFRNFSARFSNAAPAEDYDYDEYDDEYDDFDDEDESGYYEDERIVDEAPKTQPKTTARLDSSNKVVSIHTTAQLNVVIFHPEDYKDAFAIADCLIEKNTVVLNLENTSKDVSRRVVDFLSGVAYAHRGQIKKIANRTFIITPYNVGLTGAEVIDELENNGVFF